ncbi:hypothetical protein AAVH_31915, partial [Aphelenchoides avenae]
MSNPNSSQPSSPPPVEHYDVIYEDDVHSLAALMAHDKREYWTLMLDVVADETVNQAKLDYLKEHIAALQEEYALLTKTIKALATTGKNWMIDAAKHPADDRGPQRTKFSKIREDHGVVTLESNARSKQAAFKDEIKKHKELYRYARSILLHRTAGHKRRKADQSDQSKLVADANSQSFATEDVGLAQLQTSPTSLKPLQTQSSEASPLKMMSKAVRQGCNQLPDIANLGRADRAGRSLEELEEKLPSDLRREVFRCQEEDDAPDQNNDGPEKFGGSSKVAPTECTGTHAILSNKKNGTHRTTLLECVKVTVGHPTDKSQQCETVLLLDSASDHTDFKQSLCEMLHLPNLGPTKLSVATFLSTDEITVDTFVSQLRIRKSNGKTICLRAPVMPDQFVGQMRTAFGRPEHIKELRQGSCAVCPSTETPEILFSDATCVISLKWWRNINSYHAGSGKAGKPADVSELSNHQPFFIRAKSDDVSINQLLESLLADDSLTKNTMSSFRDQLDEKVSYNYISANTPQKR